MPAPHQKASDLFDVCSIFVDNHPKRGVRISCGYCKNREEQQFNTVKTGAGHDDDVIERLVMRKFEKTGWKIGKTATQHRCPSCFSNIKQSAVRKSQMTKPTLTPVATTPVTHQVTPITQEVRLMTRDERRIIFEKINEVYVGEKVGYSDNWTDEKVALDLGVARKWVTDIREDMFGPDINEAQARLTTEAKELIEEIKKTREVMDVLVKHAERIQEQLSNLKR